MQYSYKTQFSLSIMKSYRNGYVEASVFLFYRNGSILIEHRPGSEGKETFIPNGTIEDKDKGIEEDYRIVAMKREALEEMNVKVTEFEYLTEYKVEEPRIWFYCYVITGWKGEIPHYTIEEGKKFADLEWINLKEYKDYFHFQSALFMCEKLIEYLKEKEDKS